MDLFLSEMAAVAATVADKEMDKRSAELAVLGTLIEFLTSSPCRLQEAWRDVLQESKSITIRQNDAFRLVTAYRPIANFLSTVTPRGCADLEAALQEAQQRCGRARFGLAVMVALFRLLSSGAVDDAEKLRVGTSVRELVPNLPVEAHISLLDALCACSSRFEHHPQDGDFEGKDINASHVLRHCIPADWLLDGSWLLLRLAKKDRPSRPSSKPGVLKTLQLILSLPELYQTNTVIDVVDMLLLRKPFDDDIAAAVVDALPDSRALVECLDVLGATWGNKFFLARGDLKMQQYLVCAILRAIERAGELQRNSGDFKAGEWLNQSGSSSNESLVMIFTAGVSAVFESSIPATRLLGMRVAMAMADLNGQQLFFDEVREADEAAAASRHKQSENNNQATALGEVNVQEPDFKAEEIADSDADSELDAFDLEIDADKEERASYLSTCLELLRCSDTNSQAHDKHLRALHSIPAIVSTGPLDASDLCSVVVKELIRMCNTFNMSDFDSLRGEGLLSLVSAYPQYCVASCTGAIATEEVMLGAKLLCVTVLIKAAHVLSGVPYGTSERGAPAADKENKDKVKRRDAGNNHQATGKSESDGGSASQRVGVTRIKRPAKLARSKLKPRIFRNAFASVAHLFFHPVAAILSKLEKNAAVKRGRRDDDDGDGIESLLPSQLLLALAAFTVCAVNAPMQKAFIDESLVTAMKYREHSSLHVRRSALTVVLASLDAWAGYREQSRVNAPSWVHQSPLAALSNLGGEQRYQELSLADANVGSAVVTLVDWCLASLPDEADPQSRELKKEIARCVMRLDKKEN